jgi:hypothetical protein
VGFSFYAVGSTGRAWTGARTTPRQAYVPISPELPQQLAARLYRVASDAELVLIRYIARQLGAGLESPSWAVEKLGQVRALQTLIETHAQYLFGVSEAEVATAVLTGQHAGVRAAVADVPPRLAAIVGARSVPPSSDAALILTRDAITAIRGTYPIILRSTLDAYRQAVAEVSGRVLLGAQTRRQIAQEVLDRFARQGISGFVDRIGRRWELASYAEMATRTAVQKAQTAAFVGQLSAQGMDLVQVSNAPQECKLCRPWEGQILSTSGRTAGYKTLQEAESAGLFHPNCRHSLAAWIPGVSTPHAGPTADPQGDQDRQRLRALERQLRAWKRLEAAALDDSARSRARANVRVTQGRIRTHVASTTAKRQPAREQIGKAR